MGKASGHAAAINDSDEAVAFWEHGKEGGEDRRRASGGERRKGKRESEMKRKTDKKEEIVPEARAETPAEAQRR